MISTIIKRYLTFNQSCVTFIVLVFIAKLYAILFFGADIALFPSVYKQLFCPPHCWDASTNIPYSVMWTWLNPLWLGRFWYGVYVFVFDAITCTAFWFCKRIPHKYLALLQGMSVMFYLNQGSEYQNVTIMVWIPLMFFAIKNGKVLFRRLIPLAAIPILIKLPIGWSLPWVMNDHVLCVYQCSGYARVHTLYSFFANIILDLGILMFSWAWTLYDWVLATRKQNV